MNLGWIDERGDIVHKALEPRNQPCYQPEIPEILLTSGTKSFAIVTYVLRKTSFFVIGYVTNYYQVKA